MKNIESNVKILTIKPPKKYTVDFDTVKNFNDLKNIVQILFVGMPIVINENFEFINEIKEYLIELD